MHACYHIWIRLSLSLSLFEYSQPTDQTPKATRFSPPLLLFCLPQHVRRFGMRRGHRRGRRVTAARALHIHADAIHTCTESVCERYTHTFSRRHKEASEQPPPPKIEREKERKREGGEYKTRERVRERGRNAATKNRRETPHPPSEPLNST